MPWTEMVVNDFAEVVGGGTPSTTVPEYWDGDIPWITPKDLSDTGERFTASGARSITLQGLGNSGARLLPPGSVLFSSRAPIGLVSIAREEVATNQGFKSLIPKADFDSLFIYYLLKNNVPYIESRANGSTFKEINGAAMRGLEFRVPHLAEQRAIASILGALDDKIEVNRKMAATLAAIARMLFKSWFVDFDPVRAKAEGRATGLAPEFDALFTDRFESDGQPYGWKRLLLREVADVTSGGTPSKSASHFWDGSIPWISPKVMTDIHVTESDDYVTEDAVGNGTRIAAKGSVLVMVRGMGLHRGVRISQARRDVTFNQDVKALSPVLITPSHLLFGVLSKSSYLFENVEASGHGTGVIPTSALDRMTFTTPEPNSIAYDTMLGVFEVFNERIALANTELDTLVALRDVLLPKLISGELRVNDIERILEKSA